MTYVPFTPISNILLGCLRALVGSSCTLHLLIRLSRRFWLLPTPVYFIGSDKQQAIAHGYKNQKAAGESS
jgi:hypothetical protein